METLQETLAQANDARACQLSLWLSLLHAERLGWSEVADVALLLYQHVLERRHGGAKQ